MTDAWFYTCRNDMVGPLTLGELRAHAFAGKINIGARIRRGRNGTPILAPKCAELAKPLTVDEAAGLKAATIELIQELNERIPHWLATNVAKVEWTTESYGVMGKCASYTEQILKNSLLLLSEEGGGDADSSRWLGTDTLTLGERVRLIKARLPRSSRFQNADRVAVGGTFDLLDRLVALRNRLVHAGVTYDTEKARQELPLFLRLTEALCNSWFLTTLLCDSKPT